MTKGALFENMYEGCFIHYHIVKVLVFLVLVLCRMICMRNLLVRSVKTVNVTVCGVRMPVGQPTIFQ